MFTYKAGSAEVWDECSLQSRDFESCEGDLQAFLPQEFTLEPRTIP